MPLLYHTGSGRILQQLLQRFQREPIDHWLFCKTCLRTDARVEHPLRQGKGSSRAVLLKTAMITSIHAVAPAGKNRQASSMQGMPGVKYFQLLAAVGFMLLVCIIFGALIRA